MVVCRVSSLSVFFLFAVGFVGGGLAQAQSGNAVVQLFSIPSGAYVVVNGKTVGRTPYSGNPFKAMLQRTPLIYLYGLTPGWYLPIWPVFIVGEDAGKLNFQVAVDDARLALPLTSGAGEGVEEGRRKYITASTQVRLHQSAFRMRVLRAYQQSCAICRLKHPELLEAAHIVPDRDPRGAPTVTNGMSLCGLHHTAFDRHVLGIRPDFRIELRPDILEEEDGPMLRHGLQGFQGKVILLPRRKAERPNGEFLEERYEQFRKAG